MTARLSESELEKFEGLPLADMLPAVQKWFTAVTAAAPGLPEMIDAWDQFCDLTERFIRRRRMQEYLLHAIASGDPAWRQRADTCSVSVRQHEQILQESREYLASLRLRAKALGVA